ncbi:MAG: aspartate carbamoyltransferase [Chloroflexota bacterium]
MFSRLNSFSLALLLLLVGCQAQANSPAEPARLAEVAQRGAQVMPFDLERTTHIFKKLDNGGLQQVISDDQDPEQVGLIRSHLATEARRFSQGDFHDPQMIHGDNMAGLHQLMTGYKQVNVTYSEIENGAQILYTTEDENLVAALHHWFDAQLSDHAPHAQAEAP